MKSLEIVNNTIVKQQTIEIKGTDRLPSIFVDDIRIAGVKWNDSPNINYISAKINTHSRVISMDDLKEIKQDLEVLEILRKNMNTTNGTTTDGKTVEIFITAITKNNLEKFNKLKQWLEVNDDEKE